MPSYVPEIRKGFERLKMIYPDAVFPPVYFVIGRRNSGGTDSDNGLIIGAEMFADAGSRIHLSEVVCIVIHELIHYQQQAEGNDLVTQVMKEGAADFIAELNTGNQIDELLVLLQSSEKKPGSIFRKTQKPLTAYPLVGTLDTRWWCTDDSN